MVSHCDEEDLSLVALGEAARAEDTAHLSTCARCQSRLDQLTAVVASARSIQPADRPASPPPSVWAAIQAEVAEDRHSNVVFLDERRRAPRLWWVAASAAVVGLLVGGGLVGAVNSTSPSADVVATATLSPIGDSLMTGTATVLKAPDGNSLTVEIPGLPTAGDAYYEVWMATPDTATMVAVGTLRPGQSATFLLPAGLDPGQFPVVDVSLEHFDGDAGHSATSIVRGQLAT
jgi:hypothetical protein